MLRTLLAPLAAAFVLAGVANAGAQTTCADRGDVLERLSQSYKESPTAMGLASNGGVVEVLTSRSGGWTLLLTTPDGRTCVVAAGEAWETLPRIALGPTA